MSDINRIRPYLDNYLQRWLESTTARRISDVEVLAITTGRASEWEGVTITDFWLGILLEYTDLLRANPDLLKTEEQIIQETEGFRLKLQTFIDDEQKLIDKADELSSKMESYKMGRLDPRWHKTRKELHETVNKFRLSDEKYQFNWDALPKK